MSTVYSLMNEYLLYTAYMVKKMSRILTSLSFVQGNNLFKEEASMVQNCMQASPPTLPFWLQDVNITLPNKKQIYVHRGAHLNIMQFGTDAWHTRKPVYDHLTHFVRVSNVMLCCPLIHECFFTYVCIVLFLFMICFEDCSLALSFITIWLYVYLMPVTLLIPSLFPTIGFMIHIFLNNVSMLFTVNYLVLICHVLF